MPFCRCLDTCTAEPKEFPGHSVLCLGNFDGVHSAHIKLLSEGKSLASVLGADCAVWCFDPPSSDFFGAGVKSHLTVFKEKLACFKDAGINTVFTVDFNELRNMPPEEFTKVVLSDECHAIGAVCGYNFRYGKHGAGNADSLLRYFGSENIRVISEVIYDGITVSSTEIRRLIAAGNITAANSLLGRPYSLTSPVVNGKMLGRQLGYPTANQYFPDGKLVPATGIYAARCLVDGNTYRAVANIGSRPTVDNNGIINCESYIIGFSGDLYGKTVTMEFLSYLRRERTFDDIGALTKAIGNDVRHANNYFRGKPI